MLLERLESIRSRVERLRSTRGDHWNEFGVASHGFRFRGPASPARIARFELAHDVSIPPDLRAFVATVGNGGAGPYHGILPIEDWIGLGDDEGRDPLPIPSPLDPGLARVANWFDHIPGGWAVDPYTGLLGICSCGCTYWCTVVLSGPCRGRICYVNEDRFCEPPYFVEEPDFLSWYERWLDEIEAGRDLSYFGFGPRGADWRLARVVQGQAEMEDRACAHWERWRARESAGAETLEIVRDVVDGPSPDIRRAAVPGLSGIRSDEATGALGHALRDPDPTVRRAAVRAFWRRRRLGLPILYEVFLGQLECDDPETIQLAAFALVEGPGRHARRLLPLLEHQDSGVRQAAVHGLGVRGGDWAGPGLARALDDPDLGVRLSAIRALGDLGDRTARRLLLGRRTVEVDPVTRLHIESSLGISRDDIRRLYRRFKTWLLDTHL